MCLHLFNYTISQYLRQTEIDSPVCQQYRPVEERQLFRYLGRDISVMVVLQQQRSGLDVIFLGGDVQCWQSNLAAKVVLEQNSNDFVMTLLQCHSQRRKPVLQAPNIEGTLPPT